MKEVGRRRVLVDGGKQVVRWHFEGGKRDRTDLDCASRLPPIPKRVGQG